MKHTMLNVLTIVTMALSAAFFVPQALAQQSQKPAPSTMDTRIGELQYEVGFPTAETAQKLYDEMDFQRAVLAYQYAETLVSFNEMNEGFKAIGANEGDVSVFERFLDLAREYFITLEVSSTPNTVHTSHDIVSL